ncbi:hypothetical protein DPV78_012572 [Talaromyces pinophilus]|nr:hypothetical protein DPV78_012572 [Talaromyces pinophilus]
MEPTKVSNTAVQPEAEISLYEMWAQDEPMYKKVAKKLLEEEERGLREVLAVPKDHRDKNGDICERDFISQYITSDISREVYGRSDIEIPDDLAKHILIEASAEAVADLVFDLNRHSIAPLNIQPSQTPQDGYRRIVIAWESEKPKIPDFLKGHPVIAVREETMSK